jgi:hypothetical protein
MGEIAKKVDSFPVFATIKSMLTCKQNLLNLLSTSGGGFACVDF